MGHLVSVRTDVDPGDPILIQNPNHCNIMPVTEYLLGTIPKCKCTSWLVTFQFNLFSGGEEWVFLTFGNRSMLYKIRALGFLRRICLVPMRNSELCYDQFRGQRKKHKWESEPVAWMVESLDTLISLRPLFKLSFPWNTVMHYNGKVTGQDFRKLAT